MGAPKQDHFDKDRFDSVLALVAFRRELRAARLARTWQILLVLWAGLAAAALQSDKLPVWALVAIALATPVVAGFWIYDNHSRDKVDVKEMHRWGDQAARALDESWVAPRHDGFAAPDQWIQFIVTLALCAVLGTVAYTTWSSDEPPTSRVTMTVDN